MNLTGKTETGRRSHNEDSFCISSEPNGRIFAAVSDGMGGHAAGETASRLSIETVSRIFHDAPKLLEGTLALAFSEANRVVFETAEQHPDMYGMGATLVCAVPFPTRFLAANVGDSRLYLFHNGALRQITHDHSYVAELVRREIITPEEAKTHPRRNWVTRAIGTEPHVKVDLFSEEWEAGDILILCSDGLFCSLNDADFCRILASCADLDDACETLSARAYENGSSDNITVVLIQNAEDAQ